MMQTAEADAMQADVERSLDAMQALRDYEALREMNGQKCAGKQIFSLRRYMSSGIGWKKREDSTLQ
jgi:hypothetical protein